MPKRLAAVIVAAMLAATLPPVRASAQVAAAATSRSVGAKLCSAQLLTNKDLNGYQRFRKMEISALRDQLKQCHDFLLTLRARGGDQRTPAFPLTDAQIAMCDPSTIRDDDNPNVVATLINSYCGGLAALRPAGPFQVTAAQLLYVATSPTIYVIMSAGGAPPSSADTGTGSSSSPPSAIGAPVPAGPAVSAPATSPSAANSNGDALMLYVVARRLREAYCARIGRLTPDKECDTAKLLADPSRALAIVPESQWKIEDFRTQCAGDPYTPDGPGHGTLGAIVLNGSTSTQDGAFAFAVVTGRSEVNYTAEVLSCDAENDQTALAQQLWAENITRSKRSTAVSFYLPALIGALAAVNVTSKSAFIPQPTVNAPGSSVQAFTNFQIYSTLGAFAANSSGLVVGNPNSGTALRIALEKLADQIVFSFNAACIGSTSYSSIAICREYAGKRRAP